LIVSIDFSLVRLSGANSNPAALWSCLVLCPYCYTLPTRKMGYPYSNPTFLKILMRFRFTFQVVSNKPETLHLSNTILDLNGWLNDFKNCCIEVTLFDNVRLGEFEYPTTLYEHET